MKILLVNTLDIIGGAARAAYRLHIVLREFGIDSWMLVQNKVSDDYTVIGPKTKLQKAVSKILPTVDQLPVQFYRKKTSTPFSPSWIGNKNILRTIKSINPDIVHLHWICGGMLRIKDLAKIKKPLIWNLHDMWAFTGGCHYDEECNRYKDRCGNCKVLGSNKENDLSRKIWNRKQKFFSLIPNMTIVGLSKWLTRCAENSSLLKGKKIINLPNPINTNIFKPFDKAKARKIWNLPRNKFLILFGAMSPTSDSRKGFKEIIKTFEQLVSPGIELVIFGSSEPKNTPHFKLKTYFVGKLNDDISLVTLYNAVDVMLVPSLQENLSNTIMESLSCSTPVVAFDIGGNRDMIKHKKNGYLAKPFDTTELASGIEWILNLSKKEYRELSENAREKVLKEFDSRVVVKKYVDLYEEMLKS